MTSTLTKTPRSTYILLDNGYYAHRYNIIGTKIYVHEVLVPFKADLFNGPYTTFTTSIDPVPYDKTTWYGRLGTHIKQDYSNQYKEAYELLLEQFPYLKSDPSATFIYGKIESVM